MRVNVYYKSAVKKTVGTNVGNICGRLCVRAVRQPDMFTARVTVVCFTSP